MSDERWEELYQAYGPIIYELCRKILNDDGDAQDATQETFLLVYHHLEKVRNVNEALPWIYQIATRYCLSLLRKWKRQAAPMAELPERMGDNSEESFSNRDFILKLLDRVPEKVQVVAWLHYMEGMKQSEVAHVLDVSRRTVVYRLTEFSEAAARLKAGDSEHEQ